MTARARMRSRAAAARLSLVLAAVSFAACAEVDTSTSTGYEPAKITEIDGGEAKQVTFTREGATRTGLQTASVERRGALSAVPYEALMYDQEGATFVYASPRPLTYLRAPVEVDRVKDGRVLLRSGPPVGTTVVTVGAAEVFGAELGIAGGH